MQAILEVSSVALAKIDTSNLPVGFASACLMDYHGRRLLLAVAHAARKGPPLALALGWEPSMRRVKLWRLGGLNFLVRGELDRGATALDQMKVTDVDFAYPMFPRTSNRGWRKLIRRAATYSSLASARSGVLT